MRRSTFATNICIHRNNFPNKFPPTIHYYIGFMPLSSGLLLNLFVTYFHIPSFCLFVQTGQKGFRRCKDLVSDDILMRSIMVTRCEVDAPVVTPAPDFHFLTIQSFYVLLLYED